MATSLLSFAQSLVAQGLLSENLLQTALTEAQQKQIPLAIYLAQKQILSPQIIAQAAADFSHLPLIDLSHYDLHAIPLDLLEEKLIRKHWLLPLQKNQQQLQVAMVEPSHALDEIKFHTGLTIQPVIAAYDQLSRAIETFLSRKQYAVIKEFNNVNNANQEDAPIVLFVQQILTDAIQQGASDIHFEPYENFYRIRMRIDGILYEMTYPPIELNNRIAARLKVLAKLDISERRLPQDGRFTIATENLSRECRLSTCPTLYGEKVVVRILDNTQKLLNIDELGFDAKQKETFANAIQQPQGMILVTGPTGSGKTVTLYTALNLLNSLDKNISTVEDPVEINLAGINQVNVNTKIGLSFSQTLRSFLRQDPDIIMVGEIRDLETAEIAIKAAQTGHLVFSTLHTNSAAETLTRLLNMGIAPFNIASSITLIIAQRLVRRLCPHCKKPQALPAEILLQEGFNERDITALKIFMAGECKHCIKGYKGRIGIYEMLPLNDILAPMILQQANALNIADKAKELGLKTLRQAALEKVQQGITSLTEVNEILGTA